MSSAAATVQVHATVLNAEEPVGGAKLEGVVPWILLHGHDAERRRRRVLLCVDASGSMIGEGWHSVQHVVRHTPDELAVDVIVFNDIAESSSVEELLVMEAGGGTDFDRAVAKIVEYVKTRCRDDSIVVVFMSDGQSTLSTLNSAQQEIGALARERAVCVHALGFTRDHDRAVLQSLTTLGTAEGMFEYADDPNELVDKFQRLVGVADRSSCALLVPSYMSVPEARAARLAVAVDIIKPSHAREDASFRLVLANREYSALRAHGAHLCLGGHRYEVNFTEELADQQEAVEVLAAQHLQATTVPELSVYNSTLNRLVPYEAAATAPNHDQAIRWLAARTQLALQTELLGSAASNPVAAARLQAMRSSARMSNVYEHSALEFAHSVPARALQMLQLPPQVERAVRAAPLPTASVLEAPDVADIRCELSGIGVREVLDSPTNVLVWGMHVDRARRDSEPRVSVSSVPQCMFERQGLDMHFAAMQVPMPGSLRDELAHQRCADGSLVPNAYLPVTLCDEHVARGVAMVERTLALLFTGDPTSMHPHQNLALHALLADVSKRAAQAEPGDAKEWLGRRVQDLHRLCRELRAPTFQALHAAWHVRAPSAANMAQQMGRSADVHPVEVLNAFPDAPLWDPAIAQGMRLASLSPAELDALLQQKPSTWSLRSATGSQPRTFVNVLMTTIHGLPPRALDALGDKDSSLWQVLVGGPMPDMHRNDALQRLGQWVAQARPATFAEAKSAVQAFVRVVAVSAAAGVAAGEEAAGSSEAAGEAAGSDIVRVTLGGTQEPAQVSTSRIKKADEHAQKLLKATSSVVGDAGHGKWASSLEFAQRRMLAAYVLLQARECRRNASRDHRDPPLKVTGDPFTDPTVLGIMCKELEADLWQLLQNVHSARELELSAMKPAYCPSLAEFAGFLWLHADSDLLRRGVDGARTSPFLRALVAHLASGRAKLPGEKAVLLLRGTWLLAGDPHHGHVGKRADQLTQLGAEVPLWEDAAVWGEEAPRVLLQYVQDSEALGHDMLLALQEQLRGRPTVAGGRFHGWGVA